MIETQLLRFAPYGIALIAIAWMGFVVTGWKHDSERLQVVDKEFAVYRQGQETAARVRKEVSDEYQAEIAKLHTDRDAAPPRTVRLCSNPQLPSSPEPPSEIMVPPPEPGHFRKSLDQDLTLGEGSTTTPTKPTK